MSDNARELLKEARLAMLRSQPDEQIETIKRIDAYLVAPSESAMEIMDDIREMKSTGYLREDFTLPDSDAAALIEGYGRRVPRVMLEEIWVEASRFDANGEYKSIDEIAAKHGYKVEG